MKKLWVCFGLALVLSGLSWFGLGWQDSAKAKTEGKAAQLQFKSELDFGQLAELGGSYTSELKVKNTSSETIKLDLSFAPSKIEGLADKYKKAVDWLAIVGGEIHQTVSAQEEKTIRVRVTLPSDALAGSQYAQIVLKDIEHQREYSVSVKMNIMGDGLKYAGKLENSYAGILNFDDKVRAGVEVKNTGTAGYKLKYSLKVRSGFSQTAEWRALIEAEEEVAPETNMKLEQSEAYEFGFYTIEQRYEYVNENGQKTTVIRTQNSVNCPWWILAGIGGILVIGIVLVIIKKKSTVKSKKE